VLFPVPAHPVLPEWALLVCAGVGIAAGLASGILTALVYAFEDLFQRLPIHWMWWPALGGLAVGIGGLIYPRALGVGYDLIGDLLAGRGTPSMIYGVLLVKSLIWAIALGSGTSGGVLAPLLMIGGALGVLESEVIPVGTSGFWALIGMAAIMGGTMRAPLTAMVFAVELTNDFHALLPLLVACSAAFGTTVLLLRRSILTEKLARRGQHITREYAIDPFEITRVGDIMVQDVDTIPGTTPVEQVVRFFTTEDRGGAARHKSYPVIDADGALLGMVSRGDAIRWLSAGWSHGATLGDTITSNDTVFGHPDEPVAAIERRMAESGFGRIPVVRPENRVVVGIVSRKDLLHVRARLNAEEQERQSLLRVSRWAANVGKKPGIT
jgi:CBS domain-containing protein